MRTPLTRLNVDDAPAQVFLKLENLQPTGSFKARGASNALALLGKETLAGGVWTASAGNMGQALAWCAQRLGIPCSVVLPEDAPAVKIAALTRLGARIVTTPFAEYQQIQRQHDFADMPGTLVHPFSDPAVMAGNAVIGLEILDDLPDVEAIVVPYGGGGLSCGIASAVRALRPEVKVYACEVETAAPLAACLAAGRLVEIEYRASFVSGIGAPFVFPEMWPLASQLLERSLVVSLGQVADAIRRLAERAHIIVEGAGAAATAAALAGMAGKGKVACIVSGSNIDLDKLITVLLGHVPE